MKEASAVLTRILSPSSSFPRALQPPLTSPVLLGKGPEGCWDRLVSPLGSRLPVLLRPGPGVPRHLCGFCALPGGQWSSTLWLPTCSAFSSLSCQRPAGPVSQEVPTPSLSSPLPVDAPLCPWAVALGSLLTSQSPHVSLGASARGAWGLLAVSCCFLLNAPEPPPPPPTHCPESVWGAQSLIRNARASHSLRKSATAGSWGPTQSTPEFYQ